MKILSILALSLVVSACTKPAQDPHTIAEQYWSHIQAGNTNAAKILVSADTRPAFEKNIATLKPVKQFTLDNTRTSITTVLIPVAPESRQTQPFETVLVLEHGQWRIDAAKTQVPVSPEEKAQQLSDELSKTMEHNLDSLDEAMHEGLQLLNDALRDGSRDMSESFLKGMKELNESMQRSIEQLKKHRQQQPPPASTPDPNKGEGVI